MLAFQPDPQEQAREKFDHKPFSYALLRSRFERFPPGHHRPPNLSNLYGLDYGLDKTHGPLSVTATICSK